MNMNKAVNEPIECCKQVKSRTSTNVLAGINNREGKERNETNVKKRLKQWLCICCISSALPPLFRQIPYLSSFPIGSPHCLELFFFLMSMI